jgi:GNAT superfamily N-acetyltransferase
MLERAYNNSEYVVSAWLESGELVGLGRAISDMAFTVYFPDLLVKPNWQNKGIGAMLMNMMIEKFGQFHNMVLIAEDNRAREFYQRSGFQTEQNALSIINPFVEIGSDQ